jgi:hypothetical protein
MIDSELDAAGVRDPSLREAYRHSGSCPHICSTAWWKTSRAATTPRASLKYLPPQWVPVSTDCLVRQW